MSKWWLRSCAYWWFLRLALWLRCSLSAYPVIIIAMLTSSTSTSSSSWKCLKVNIRTTIVVASGSHPDIFVSSITSSFHHYSTLHLTWSNWCVNKLISIQPKNRLLGSLSISHLGSFLHFKEGLPTPEHLYWEPQATREESQIFTSAFLHGGPSETRPTWWVVETRSPQRRTASKCRWQQDDWKNHEVTSLFIFFKESCQYNMLEPPPVVGSMLGSQIFLVMWKG